MEDIRLIKKEKKKKDVYNYLLSFTSKLGYPPSVREICKELSIKSTSTVHAFLKELEVEGLVKRDPSKPRALEISAISGKNNSSSIINIPILGKIAAGTPILADDNRDGIFPMSINYLNVKDDLFILKIYGDSMIDIGILDSDYVIIEKCSSVPNGTIAAVLIENEATLKTFYKEDNQIRLQAENNTMQDIIVKSCSILGKLVGLYRRY